MTKAHAFIDGNKRAGFVAMELFLALNSHELRADDGDTERMMHGVAAGTISDDDFVTWVRGHAAPRA